MQATAAGKWFIVNPPEEPLSMVYIMPKLCYLKDVGEGLQVHSYCTCNTAILQVWFSLKGRAEGLD